MRLELHHVRCFRTVAEELSFSAAARRLGLSQQAVSGQISRLESAFGRRLFVRRADGVLLSSAGAELLTRVRALEEAFERVEDLLASPLGPAPLRMGTEMAGLGQHLATSGEDLLGTQVRATEEPADQTIVALGEGELDVVQCYDFPAAAVEVPRGCRSTVVLTEPTSVAVLPHRHPLAARTSVRLRELAGDVWLTRPAGTRLHRFIVEACRRCGFEPDIRYQTSDSWTIDGYVRDAGCVTLGSPLSAPSEYATYVLLDEELPREVKLLWAPSRVPAERAQMIAEATRSWYLYLARTRNPTYWQRHLAPR